MKTTERQTIDIIAWALTHELTNAGWKMVVEDDDAFFKQFSASNTNGPLGAFSRLDLILMALDNDLSNVEIRFHFLADPRVVGINKRPFGKKVRENNFQIPRSVCDTLLKRAGIKAKQEEIEMSPRAGFKVKFSGNAYLAPSYVVELVYWKKPL